MSIKINIIEIQDEKALYIDAKIDLKLVNH